MSATMLPERPTSHVENFAGAEIALHIGKKRVTLDPDPDVHRRRM
jgi:hypothetical protein